MAGRTLVVLSAAVMMAGCGQASEDAFNDSFDENFVSSCLSSATGAGVPNDQAQQACDCGLAEINDKYSMTEKITLSDEQVQPIAERCFAEAAAAAGGAPAVAQ
jgi:hypothetical protein